MKHHTFTQHFDECYSCGTDAENEHVAHTPEGTSSEVLFDCGAVVVWPPGSKWGVVVTRCPRESS